MAVLGVGLHRAVAARFLAVLILLSLAVPACADRSGILAGLPLPGRGGTLRLQGHRPSTLDPALAQDVSSWHYMLQIYSGLVSLDADLNVVPDAAASYSISADGRVYTFTIREDARFQDGKLLGAEDFRFAIDRALDPTTRSPTALQYLGDIVGALERRTGRAQSVSGVRVRDQRTLEIEIDAPKRYFLSKLTYPTAFAVDRENVAQGANWFEHPNGSGPFQVLEWKRDESLRLGRNERYYGEGPRLAELFYVFGPIPPMFLYERGELDVIEVGLSDIERVTDPKGLLNRELRVTPVLSLWYIGFNTTIPPFDDVKVRQAFALATDRARLASIRFKGTRQRAHGIMPPGLPGHDEDRRSPELDIERAKLLLSESRYAEAGRLPEVTISVSQGSGQLAAGLAHMYERNLGMPIAVQEIENDFLGELENHAVQMFYVGWIADYPDPENFVDLLFHSGSRGNYSGYANPELDDLLVRARVEQDSERRLAMYRDAERMILDDAAIVPLVHDVSYVLVRPRVRGFTVTPMGILSLRDVYLD